MKRTGFHHAVAQAANEGMKISTGNSVQFLVIYTVFPHETLHCDRFERVSRWRVPVRNGWVRPESDASHFRAGLGDRRLKDLPLYQISTGNRKSCLAPDVRIKIRSI
jgi:hypothetical protein